MEMYRADTIVACATPAGRGAIAVVRCSGRDVLQVSEALFRPKTPGRLEPWRMCLGTIVAADGTTPIDQVLGVYFPGPNSFTGEDTFEIHCHGSPVLIEQVVASAIAVGARAAERGEFTRRAVLNGKLDLLQAEAIADLVDSRMVAGSRAAWGQLQGALSDRFAAIRAALLALLADIEAEVDFTEDELPPADFARRVAAMDTVVAELDRLLASFAVSRRLRDGIRVAFTGKPNAGKSSLVNRLLGSGRMIVSDEPGTTRDIVEESVDLGGVAFILTDTAGIRETCGVAETQAVERARHCVEESDLRVLVLDASVVPDERDFELWEIVRGVDTIVVLNKRDLGVCVPSDFQNGIVAEGAVLLETCAQTGEGCAALAEAMMVYARHKLDTDLVGISRVRHRSALERTAAALRRARRFVASEDACELAVAEIRIALAELADISSPVDNEEILDLIFSEFCIGK